MNHGSHLSRREFVAATFAGGAWSALPVSGASQDLTTAI